MRACFQAGLGTQPKARVHEPHDNGSSVLKVSMVRHPCDWLASYWNEIGNARLGIPTDVFAPLPADDFDDFVRAYLKKIPGAIEQIFDAYHGDSYLRLEDQPWALEELLESVGVSKPMRELVLMTDVVNQSKNEIPIWSKSLRRRVEDAERGLMERFNYA